MRLEKALNKYIDTCENEKCLSHQTIEGCRYYLEKFIKAMPAGDITELNCHNVQAFFDDLVGSSVAQNTKRYRYSLVMRFLNYYYKLGIIKFDPYFWIKKIESQRSYKIPLTRNEAISLLEVDYPYKRKKYFQYSRDKIILGLLIYCGMRVGEIIRLKVKDISFASQIITIIGGKYRIDRIIPLEDPLITWIKNHVRRYTKKKSSYLIEGLFQKDKVVRTTINRIIKKYAKAANITGRVHSHLLRHSFASFMLKGGVELDKLKILMGHIKVEQTAIYAKPDFEMISSALLTNPLIKYLGGEP